MIFYQIFYFISFVCKANSNFNFRLLGNIKSVEICQQNNQIFLLDSQNTLISFDDQGVFQWQAELKQTENVQISLQTHFILADYFSIQLILYYFRENGHFYKQVDYSINSMHPMKKIVLASDLIIISRNQIQIINNENNFTIETTILEQQYFILGAHKSQNTLQMIIQEDVNTLCFATEIEKIVNVKKCIGFQQKGFLLLESKNGFIVSGEDVVILFYFSEEKQEILERKNEQIMKILSNFQSEIFYIKNDQNCLEFYHFQQAKTIFIENMCNSMEMFKIFLHQNIFFLEQKSNQINIFCFELSKKSISEYKQISLDKHRIKKVFFQSKTNQKQVILLLQAENKFLLFIQLEKKHFHITKSLLTSTTGILQPIFCPFNNIKYPYVYSKNKNLFQEIVYKAYTDILGLFEFSIKQDFKDNILIFATENFLLFAFHYQKQEIIYCKNYQKLFSNYKIKNILKLKNYQSEYDFILVLIQNKNKSVINVVKFNPFNGEIIKVHERSFQKDSQLVNLEIRKFGLQREYLIFISDKFSFFTFPLIQEQIEQNSNFQVYFDQNQFVLYQINSSIVKKFDVWQNELFVKIINSEAKINEEEDQQSVCFLNILENGNALIMKQFDFFQNRIVKQKIVRFADVKQYFNAIWHQDYIILCYFEIRLQQFVISKIRQVNFKSINFCVLNFGIYKILKIVNNYMIISNKNGQIIKINIRLFQSKCVFQSLSDQKSEIEDIYSENILSENALYVVFRERHRIVGLETRSEEIIDYAQIVMILLTLIVYLASLKENY